MGKKKTKPNRSKRRKNINSTTVISSSLSLSYTNFVSEAGPGCYIARRDQSPPWLLEWEDVDPHEFDSDDIPDIAVDTDERTLTICNVHDHYKVAYVTVYETRVVGAHGRELPQGTTTDNDGTTHACVTFIVLTPPFVFVHLCVLDVGQGSLTDEAAALPRIESDVSPWRPHPRPEDEHPLRIGFPLGCRPDDGTYRSDRQQSADDPSFLCTQGENGELTHFFSGNLHAVDFQCPVGTEVLAVADGIVVDAKDTNTLTGISVNNLFEWNSIMLQICRGGEDEGDGDDAMLPRHPDGALFVEYVHIQRSLVTAGQAVTRGQVIGYTGSVGFSPEPHLHFSAFRSSDPTAPTVRVLLYGEPSAEGGVGVGAAAAAAGNTTSRPFLPKAGQRYNARGVVVL
jgi:hypothetical protein